MTIGLALGLAFLYFVLTIPAIFYFGSERPELGWSGIRILYLGEFWALILPIASVLLILGIFYPILLPIGTMMPLILVLVVIIDYFQNV